jgi:hypothetical protein
MRGDPIELDALPRQAVEGGQRGSGAATSSARCTASGSPAIALR